MPSDTQVMITCMNSDIDFIIVELNGFLSKSKTAGRSGDCYIDAIYTIEFKSNMLKDFLELFGNVMKTAFFAVEFPELIQLFIKTEDCSETYHTNGLFKVYNFCDFSNPFKAYELLKTTSNNNR